MGDAPVSPFQNFCDALVSFQTHRRQVLVRELQAAGVRWPADPRGLPLEEKVRLVRQVPSEVLLELLYRAQFEHPRNAFKSLALYKEAHPDREQFVNEFLQNADDAGARRVRFEFLPDEIRVANDGHAFTPENLHALCSYNESDKTLQEGRQIGRFGMGFKTVFRVTARPEVFTFDGATGFRLAFRFFEPRGLDVRHFERLQAECEFDYSAHIGSEIRPEHHSHVGYILPEPVRFDEELAEAVGCDLSAYGSFFRLPLTSPGVEQDLSEKGIEQVVPVDTFLFLRRVCDLTLVDRTGEAERRVRYVKEEPRTVGELDSGVVRRLIVRVEGVEEPAREWLLFEGRPSAVDRRRFGDLDVWIRELLPEQLTFALAAPLTPDGRFEPRREAETGATGRVFAFLPVKSAFSGISLDLDAPFNLTNNRAHVSDDLFNRTLVAHAADGLAELLAHLRDRGDRLSDSLHRLIPLRPSGGDVFEPLRQACVRFRGEEPFVPAHDGPLVHPTDVLVLDQARCVEAASRLLARLRRRDVVDAPRCPDASAAFVLADVNDPGTQHLAQLLTQADAARFNLDALNRILGDETALRRLYASGVEWLVDALELATRLPCDRGGQHRKAFRATPFLRTGSGRPVAPKDAVFLGADPNEIGLVSRIFPAQAPVGADLVPMLERPHRSADDWVPVPVQTAGLGRYEGIALRELDEGTPRQDRLSDLLRVLELARSTLAADQVGRARRDLRVPSCVPGAPGRERETSLDECAPAGQGDVPKEVWDLMRQADLSGLHAAAADLVREWLPSEPAISVLLEAAKALDRPSSEAVRWLLSRLPKPEAVRGRQAPRSGEQARQLRAVLRLKVAGRQQWRLAEELALRAFPDDLPASALQPLFPEAAAVDTEAYTRPGPEGSAAAERLFVDLLGLPASWWPKPEDVASAAKAVTDRNQARVLAAYVAGAVAEKALHVLLPGGDSAPWVRDLSALPWLPDRSTGRQAPPAELLLVDPRTSAGRALHDARVRCVDFGDGEAHWEKTWSALHGLVEARGLLVRDDPTEEERRAAVDAALATVTDLSASAERRRAQWEALAELTAGDAGLLVRVAPSLEDVPFVTAAGKPVALVGAERLRCRTVLVTERGLQQPVRERFGSRVEVVLEEDAAVAGFLQAALGTPICEGIANEHLLLDPDLACRLLLGTAEAAGGEVLQRQQRDCVLDAWRHLAGHGEQAVAAEDPAVLTAFGTMERGSNGICAGHHPAVRRVLEHADRRRHLVAPELRDLGDAALAVLPILDDRGWPLRGGRIGMEFRARVVDQEPQVSPDLLAFARERIESHKQAALFRDAMPGDVAAAVRAVWTDGPVQVTWSLELTEGARFESKDSFDVYVDPASRPTEQTLYLDAALRPQWDDLRREREDRDQFRQEQAARHRFEESTADAKREVEGLRDDKVKEVAYTYVAQTDDNDLRAALRAARDSIRGVLRMLLARPRQEELRRRYTVEKGYTPETLVREILQNAEDAYATAPQPLPVEPWLRVTLRSDELELRHCGRRFCERGRDGRGGDDFGKICSLGASGKARDSVTIGRFGLGFKSVFSVADRVTVRSHPYHFRLESLVIPSWDAGAFEHVRGREGETCFVLGRPEDGPLRTRFDRLAGRIRDGSDVHPAQVLFLRQIARVEVFDGDRQVRAVLRRSEPPAGWPAPKTADSVELVHVSEQSDGLGASYRFLLCRAAGSTDFSEAGLGSREPVEVAIALPVADSDGGPALGRLPDGEIWRRLFLHLPTAQDHGLPFAVHATWATEAGRNAVPQERPAFDGNWALGEKLAALLRDALAALFFGWAKDPEALATIYGVLPGRRDAGAQPSPVGGLHDVFGRMVEEGEAVFLTRSGSLVPKGRVVTGGRHMVGLYDRLRAEGHAPDVPFLDDRCRRAFAAWVGAQAGQWDYEDFVDACAGEPPDGSVPPDYLVVAARYHHGLREGGPEDPALVQEREALARALLDRPCLPTMQGGVGAPETLCVPDDDELTPLLPPDRVVDPAWLGDEAVGWFVREVLEVRGELAGEEVPELARATPDRAAAMALLRYLGTEQGWSEYGRYGHELRAMLERLGIRRSEVEPLVCPQFFASVLVPTDQLVTLLHQASAPPPPEPEREPRRLDVAALREHNLDALAEWWSQNRDGLRRYTLLGGFGRYLGLGKEPGYDDLRRALRVAPAERQRRTWFRLLACLNVAQTPRRVEEGQQFVAHLHDRGYLDRLWNDEGQGAFEGIVREALDEYFRDRRGDAYEWTTYWRRLYDFQKFRELLCHHEFAEGVLEVAHDEPREIIDFLHRGKLPGRRAEIRGLGESLKSQCFVLVRELRRAGVFVHPDLDTACYAPTGHVRWVAYCLRLVEEEPHPGSYLSIDAMYAHSRKLSELLADRDHLDGGYDLPLLAFGAERCSSRRRCHGCPMACSENPDPEALGQFEEAR